MRRHPGTIESAARPRLLFKPGWSRDAYGANARNLVQRGILVEAGVTGVGGSPAVPESPPRQLKARLLAHSTSIDSIRCQRR